MSGWSFETSGGRALAIARPEFTEDGGRPLDLGREQGLGVADPAELVELAANPCNTEYALGPRLTASHVSVSTGIGCARGSYPSLFNRLMIGAL
jgi:hypothetical protein